MDTIVVSKCSNEPKIKTNLLKCRWDGCIDNQLGHLYRNINHVKASKRYNNIDGFKLKALEAPFTNVYIVKDALSKEIVKKARDFLLNIPFDVNIPVCNDTDHYPNKSVFTASTNSKDIKNIYNVNNPKQWIWEHYSSTIWRACPLSLNSFYGTPIFTLIQMLSKKLYNTLFPDIDIRKLNMATWVIQRVEQGQNIGAHKDDGNGRKIAFIYYLTPDDWSEKDGGSLSIQKEDKEKEIMPTCNTLVMWSMYPITSPLHWVNTVHAPNTQPRLCLVGFFNQ